MTMTATETAAAPSPNTSPNPKTKNMKKEETALEWLQRVQSNKRHWFQNPIQFPCLQKSPPKQARSTITSTTSTTADNEEDIALPLPQPLFVVSKENMVRMNAQLFFSRCAEWNELQNRYKRWMDRVHRTRKRRRLISDCTTASAGTNVHERASVSTFANENQIGVRGENNNDISMRRRDVSAGAGTGNSHDNSMEKLEQELLSSCFCRGTGLPFIDQILQLQLQQQKEQQLQQNQFKRNIHTTPTPSTTTRTAGSYSADKDRNNHQNVAIEIVGRSGTGKSQILMSLAANYVAATSSSSFLPSFASSSSFSASSNTSHSDTSNINSNINSNSNISSNKNNYSSNNNNSDTEEDRTELSPQSSSSLLLPFVIILDPEHAMNVHQISSNIYSAILRRWNSTDQFREYYDLAAASKSNNNGDHHHSHRHHYDYDHDATTNNNNDHESIQRDYINALERIHIIRPKDVANGYVATLECLHQTIVEYKNAHRHCDRRDRNKSSMPPILLLMDAAMSAFEQSDKMYESLPNGNGLSGRNEFVRQLNRLRLSHDIVLVATRTIRGSSSGGGGNGNRSSNSSSSIGSKSYSNFNSSLGSSCEAWNKIITNRIELEKVIEGTKEERDGFDFVALMPHQQSIGSVNVMDWNTMVPFSVTDDGIKC